MSIGQQLQYADRVAQIWIRRYRVSPVAGRMVGFLMICNPPRQSIDELAAALRASRSAVSGAVRDLDKVGLLERTRVAGERVDRMRLIIDESRGFDPEPYREAATFAREGLDLLVDQSAERREPMEEFAALNDFLADRLPQLLQDWKDQHGARP